METNAELFYTFAFDKGITILENNRPFALRQPHWQDPIWWLDTNRKRLIEHGTAILMGTPFELEF